MRVYVPTVTLTCMLTVLLAAHPANIVASGGTATSSWAAAAGAAPTDPPSSVLVAARPSLLATIQGNALDSTNGALPHSVVRLRDARAGRIIDVQTTSPSGLFAFRGVDPGNYIVEIVGVDGSILSASQILSVDAGQAISAIVKLPFRLSPLAGLLGHTVASAAVVTSAAAASGVMAIAVAGEPVSPQ
jgi:hypothetical protein